MMTTKPNEGDRGRWRETEGGIIIRQHPQPPQAPSGSLRQRRADSGQTATEMVFLLPLLLLFAGGMLFMVYTGWQDLKIQQAANLLARAEGQEKVSGGTSIKAINDENGFGPGTGFVDGDIRVNDSNFDTQNTHVTGKGAVRLFDRLKFLLQSLYPKGGVTLNAPRSGQNVDQIVITRTMPTIHIPFMKDNAGLPQKITLKGTAYGGEDPYMYALPRWGKTAGPDQQDEWRKLIGGTPNNGSSGSNP